MLADNCVEFNFFHNEECFRKVATNRQSTVVTKQECIVVLKIRIQRIRNFHRGRRTIITGRNCTDGQYCFGQYVLVKVDVSNRERRCNGRVRVHYRVNVRAFSVHSHVHFDFGGRVQLTFQFFTISVNFDDHVRRQGCLGYARGGAIKFVVANLYGNVTVVCSNKAFLPELKPYFANFLFNFKGRFHSFFPSFL